MQTRVKIIIAQFTGCSKGQRVLLPDVTQCLTRYTMVKYTKGNTYTPRKHKVSAIMRGITVKLILYSSGNMEGEKERKKKKKGKSKQISET